MAAAAPRPGSNGRRPRRVGARTVKGAAAEAHKRLKDHRGCWLWLRKQGQPRAPQDWQLPQSKGKVEEGGLKTSGMPSEEYASDEEISL